MELCALTNTLIIDEDGCYDPTDFNDQLLLGLKGTMSHAELHFIRARLLGGKINKAKKGELKIPLPIGFCYDEQGYVRLDDDKQVRSVIQLLFKVFQEKGSACGVAIHFAKHKIQFPKRTYGGIWQGKLTWVELTPEKVCEVLKNPSYAGAYVYGRYRGRKKLSSTGQVQTSRTCLPMEAWHTIIKDHHERYISWQEYVENREILAGNVTCREENMLPTAAREGLGLLQGLLICGFCGYRLTVRYKSGGCIHPTYSCNRRQNSKGMCFSMNGSFMDKIVVEKALTAMEPAQIEIAVKAFEELEQRSRMLDKQWQMKIERADYQAQLAQKRYEEVDPSNRLVAATLEKHWNEALTALEEVRTQYAEYKKKNTFIVTQQQKEEVLALAKDLPRLWHAASTSTKDRKRILRLLIKDITVKKLSNERKAILQIRWQTDQTESLEVPLPQRFCDKHRRSEDTINRVRQLAATMTDAQIVSQLNQEGLTKNKIIPFTIGSVQWIRQKHNIPTRCTKKPEELSVKQVAERLNVNRNTVYYWIECKLINARRVESRLWVSMSSAQEQELRKRIENSSKITTKNPETQKQIERGAL